MAELTCEACGTTLAKNGDILCTECSHAYTILVDLLRKHPELAKDDLTRLKDLFDWRNRREREWIKNIFRRPVSEEKAPIETTK